MLASQHALLCHYVPHGIHCGASMAAALVLGIVLALAAVGGLFSIFNFFKDL